MNRRDAFIGSGAALMTVASGLAMAQEHAHHNHAAMHGGPNPTLIAAVADCVVKGQACLAHCLVLLGDGDKAMTGCAKMVNQMLAVCGALQNLASQQSALLPAMAKVALDACQQCEQECGKHKDKHAECKACMESCQNSAKQCKLIAG